MRQHHSGGSPARPNRFDVFRQCFDLDLQVARPLQLKILLVAHLDEQRFDPQETLGDRLHDGCDDGWQLSASRGNLSWHASTVAHRTTRQFYFVHAPASLRRYSACSMSTEQNRVAAERSRDEAEQFRVLAEDARAVRDEHREALEAIRQQQETLRQTRDELRTACEDARAVADAARHATMQAVEATAAALQGNLDSMKVIEEMRRTLRDIREITARDRS